jgi:hypothetical protein
MGGKNGDETRPSEGRSARRGGLALRWKNMAGESGHPRVRSTQANGSEPERPLPDRNETASRGVLEALALTTFGALRSCVAPRRNRWGRFPGVWASPRSRIGL